MATIILVFFVCKQWTPVFLSVALQKAAEPSTEALQESYNQGERLTPSFIYERALKTYVFDTIEKWKPWWGCKESSMSQEDNF